MKTLEEVKDFVSNMRFEIFGKELTILVKYDQAFGEGINRRIYIQMEYTDICRTTQEERVWRGRKFQISEHMTDDEIVKTAYVAFEACVKHEVMEGFTFNGVCIFNPHIDYKALMSVSDKIVKRK